MILPFSTADWPEPWQSEYEERCAIREFDGGMPRKIAEQMSEAEFRVRAERAEWEPLT